MSQVKNNTNLNQKTGKPKVSARGGARPGAGRPKGTRDLITLTQILTALEDKFDEEYAETLARHFKDACDRGDQGAILKYHALILSKVTPTLLDVSGTVAHVDNTIEGRQVAFLKALETIGNTMVPMHAAEPKVDIVIPAPGTKAPGE